MYFTIYEYIKNVLLFIKISKLLNFLKNKPDKSDQLNIVKLQILKKR